MSDQRRSAGSGQALGAGGADRGPDCQAGGSRSVRRGKPLSLPLLLSFSEEGGHLAPILNLKPLNKRYIKPRHFRMETLATILPALPPGSWAFTIDIRDE